MSPPCEEELSPAQPPKWFSELIRFGNLARPERFELPASWFVARRSIQLSYGRAMGKLAPLGGAHPTTPGKTCGPGRAGCENQGPDWWRRPVTGPAAAGLRAVCTERVPPA